ncbi:MAG TPA: helicase-exonuclease AddAB subunit AddA [Candidatus Gallacutalibacter pullistercoris]|nr:helicase-exonuclease AddAB subunit AddA [Candidatus Gallacutalibacter pullistercoris]
MAERKWTREQQDAINAREGTLLVSAAAGSGKTAVLVQRIIERITDPDIPGSIDHLLVVTFTRAAAQEMRERIAKRLAELLREDPDNDRLKRQQLLLPQARISTIHSFCSELARENFYKLDIPQDFRICEESEMTVLRGEAADEVLSAYHEEQDEGFDALSEAFSPGRDDLRLRNTLLNLYDFIRSHPFPERWLRQVAALYDPAQPAEETVWGKTLLSYGEEVLSYCIQMLKSALALCEEDSTLYDKFAPILAAERDQAETLRGFAADRDWDKLSSGLQNASFGVLRSPKGYKDDPLKVRIAAARDDAKETLKKLAGSFVLTREDCREDLIRMAPLVEKLFECVLRFSKRLDEKKLERKAADFGDLEHWAIRLLAEEDPQGGFRPTKDAVALSKRFDEIMVDEYQDTNEAQDLLFQALSQNGQNRFMVGDVKQSIYSFRQAMPRIFLRYREEFAPYDREKKNHPACVVLDKNFRSRQEVTDSVNFVFGQIMSSKIGDVEYTGAERLAAGAVYPVQPGCATRLDVLDSSLCDEEEQSAILEGRHIAGMIREMMEGGFLVTENGSQRPAQYRDFCVLLRSANKVAPFYAQEMAQCGIPSWAASVGGFFAAAEVALMLSLLRVVDNPMQDIPLLAVLMSPIYGFTPDDMADIRLEDRSLPLYLAVVRHAEKGPRCAAFLQALERFRTVAASMPSDEFLNFLYEETGYRNLVQTLPGGEGRLANLRLLHRYAKRYEGSGYNGLSGFIRFIDRLEKQKADLAPAANGSEGEDVVRIMSIHKSKGLEFPVCIVAGCGRKFNREKDDALLHPELGLGVRLKAPDSPARFSTLPREAIRLEIDRESMSEELRVLYVAMTRAKEKLILLSTLKDAEKTLAKLAAGLTKDEKLPEYTVRGASSLSDWLLSCALRHPDGKILRDRAMADEDLVLRAKGYTPWDIRVLRPDAPSKAAEAEKAQAPQPDAGLLSRLRQALSWQYPYAELADVPSKVSASGFAEEQAGGEGTGSLSRPAFLSHKGMTPAERGTALHTYMQFARYKEACIDPEKERERLVKEGFLTAEQGDAVELARVSRFFGGTLGRRILSSKNVMRETRFMAELPAREVKPGLTGEMGEEPVVLQGVVDCVFEENGALVLVDYKTDRIREPEELWRRYEVQLKLYARAVADMTGLPVKECLLYSFYLNCPVGDRGAL